MSLKTFSDVDGRPKTVDRKPTQRQRKGLPRGILTTVAAGALLGAISGCAQRQLSPLEALVAETRPTNVKIVIVGIDGATFAVMKPLIRAGRLPEFEGLIASGAHGVLRSTRPSRSPALWTTIATGRKREEHGITGFTISAEEGQDQQAEVLFSSQERRTLALWNLVGPFGKKVGFLGWWVTWPAEAVHGWMVSDRLTRSRWSEWSDGQKSEAVSFPPELAGKLRRFLVDPLDPPMDEIDRLVELSPEERAELRAANKPIFAHGLSNFKFAYCVQRTYEKIAFHLLAEGQPDLTGIFLIANDPISHNFWHFYQPERFKGVDPIEAERLGKLIPNFYRHNDRFLGQLRSYLDHETVVMVVSDHGFRASGRIPKQKSAAELAEWFDEEGIKALAEGTVALGQSGRHTLNGVFLAAGGPIRRGVKVRTKLLDIAPTVLALMGLPVPRDMPGRVLVEIIEPEFLMQHPIRRIDSYSHYIQRPIPTIIEEAQQDRKTLDMLRSLGYIR